MLLISTMMTRYESSDVMDYKANPALAHELTMSLSTNIDYCIS